MGSVSDCRARAVPELGSRAASQAQDAPDSRMLDCDTGGQSANHLGSGRPTLRRTGGEPERSAVIHRFVILRTSARSHHGLCCLARSSSHQRARSGQGFGPQLGALASPRRSPRSDWPRNAVGRAAQLATSSPYTQYGGSGHATGRPGCGSRLLQKPGRGRSRRLSALTPMTSRIWFTVGRTKSQTG